MFLNNYVKFYLWRIPERVFKKHNISMFVKTKVGIKNINMGCLTHTVKFLPAIITEMDPEKLYLGPDFLVDKYSLLDCPLLDSPHYSFIKAIQNQESIDETDYYKRYIRGTLDWRHCQLGRKNNDVFFSKNEVSKIKIIEDNYEPVTVYLWNNIYYIFDGKHRAALCALLGKQVKCNIVSPSITFNGVWKRMFDMIDDDKCFSKHTLFLSRCPKKVQ